MSTLDKKPFIQLCFCGSLTLVALLNMIYLIMKARDPFSPYLLEGLIGSVPLFPYFVLSLNAAIILLTATLLTLTSAIHADAKALLLQHVMHNHLVPEAQPHLYAEPTPPLITAHRPPLSPEDATIHDLNVQVQTLHTEIAQQRHDALIQELQNLTVVATDPEPQYDSTAPRLVVTDRHPAPLLTINSSPCTINGIGPKTETALHEIGITTIGELLVADAEWVAEHTPLTIKRVQHFQETAYARVTTESQKLQAPPAIASALS
jgi:predicted flap endonuclease-1-like 5' DNA nuclease